MRFPTFTKNQNKDCKSATKLRKTCNATLGAGQLLLTDSFQPQKKYNQPDTPKTPKLPSPLTNLFEVKNTPTTIGTLSRVSNKKFECLIDSFTPQLSASILNSSRCSTTKSNNYTKRLQRNRGLVKSKPNSFLQRPTLNNPIVNKPVLFNSTSTTPLINKTRVSSTALQQTPTINSKTLNRPVLKAKNI